MTRARSIRRFAATREERLITSEGASPTTTAGPLLPVTAAAGAFLGTELESWKRFAAALDAVLRTTLVARLRRNVGLQIIRNQPGVGADRPATARDDPFRLVPPRAAKARSVTHDAYIWRHTHCPTCPLASS